MMTKDLDTRTQDHPMRTLFLIVLSGRAASAPKLTSGSGEALPGLEYPGYVACPVDSLCVGRASVCERRRSGSDKVCIDQGYVADGIALVECDNGRSGLDKVCIDQESTPDGISPLEDVGGLGYNQSVRDSYDCVC